MRRNTLAFAGLSGMLTLVRFVELGQSYQLLPRPALSELVCTCKRQPLRSDGQLNSRLLLLTTFVMVKVLVLIKTAGNSVKLIV